MSKNLLLLPTALVTVMSGHVAQAAEGGAKLELNLPALSYSSDDTKVKQSDVTQNGTSSGFQTKNLNEMYAKIGFDRFGVYYYLFSEAKMISVSYMVTDMVEFGLDLGLNNSKTTKPDVEKSSNTMAFFVEATPKLGMINSEFILSYDSTTSKSDAYTDKETLKAVSPTNSTSNVGRLTANAVVPLTTNLNYVGGLWYQVQDDNEKKSKTKTTAGKFGVNIATLRLVLD